MLQIKNLSKKYKNLTVLDDINLEVADCEFVCILGPSGCGKTTLLRIIAGLEEPTSGTLSMNHKTIKGITPEIGMVFQEYTLFPWRNILDNAIFGLEMQGVDKNTAISKARKYLRAIGLDQFEKNYPHELSGGMKQRVAILRALLLNPQLLLMDEPFGALDAQTRNQLQSELLRIWSKDKKTVLFITHSVDEAVYLADKIVLFTARPARIKQIFNINLPRPRDRTSTNANKLRSQILKTLGAEL
ncbi:MAG TPA: ABC transporter ATP-binding protein [Methanosarcinales archaeon]|nr:ABC transporter ATP-binding protein [Methanosarcinales archaeon]